MVYCTKCGTKNEEDVEVCSSCGAQLRMRHAAEEETDQAPIVLAHEIEGRMNALVFLMVEQ